MIGIGTDFTACTVLPVLDDGTPLCEVPELATGRTPTSSSGSITRRRPTPTGSTRSPPSAASRGWRRYGGRISSEWEFAKGLQLLEEDPEIYQRTVHWIEAADWIVWQLSGVYVRNACTAGYKAILQDGAYPSREFLAALNPDFADFVVDKVERPIARLGDRVGSLTPEAARWTGLPVGIAVCTGNVDAHVTAPAAQAIEPGQMVAIMGTSTCHVMSSDMLREVPGMCGVVDGGIVPGLWGYEAGQSGVGDIFAWYVERQVPASYAHAAARCRAERPRAPRRARGRASRPAAHGLVALDWHSGNRSVLVDHELSGVVVGLTLATRPEEIYLALLEATAFGTRKIVESFEERGVPVAEFIVAGGLLKNRFLMQLYADVIGRPIGVIGSDQGPALGSAIHAAVAAGAYPDIRVAAMAMGQRRARRVRPRRATWRDLRPAVRRVLDTPRLLRARRERRHAPPARDQAGGRTMNAPTTAEAVADLRETICVLHRELVRWGLVTWTSGNVSGRVPGAEHMVIKPSGIAYDDLTPELDGGHRPARTTGGRLPGPIVGHAVPRLHLPRDARGQRDRSHAQHIRHGMGGPSRGDPVRPHRDGRRVRRPDPGRSVRPDRRRGDRPRRGLHARRPPLAGRAVGQSRRVRHRRNGDARRSRRP